MLALLGTILHLLVAAAGPVSAQARPRIVLLIGEELYQTRTALPRFAADVLEPAGFEVSTVTAEPQGGHRFPGLAALSDADLLVLSVRRRALPEDQLALVRGHLRSGKPLVAIRTSSHAFNIHGETPPEGHAVWPEFDREVLGAQYEGHYSHRGGTAVRFAPGAAGHPVVAGTGIGRFRSDGELYRSRELAESTRTLLIGRAEVEGDEVSEPVAWTNTYRGGRIFYTSLGHPEDWEEDAFRRLLLQAVA